MASTSRSPTKSPVKAKSARSDISTSTASIAAKAKALKKANSPTKEPVHDQVEDFVKCELCKHTLEDPKSLSCMHSYCRNCLVTYFTETKGPNANEISCPICLQITKTSKSSKTPEGAIDHLQTNEFLRSYLEARSLKNPDKSCDTCRRQNRVTGAIQWCRMCHDALCDNCVGFHNALKTTKQHNLIYLTKLRNEPIEGIISAPLCTTHEGENVTKYCDNHKEVLCEKCVAGSHKGCKGVMTLKEAAARNKQEITHVNNTLHEETNLAKSIYENRTKADKTVDNDQSDIVMQIQDVRKKINDNLTKCETQLIEELHKMHSKEKETIHSETKEAHRIKKSSGKIHGLAASTDKYGTDSHVLQSLPNNTAQIDHYKEKLGSLNGRIKNTRLNFVVDSTLEHLMKGISRLGELRVSSSSARLPTSRALKTARSDSDPEDELDIRGSRRTLKSDTKSLKSFKSVYSSTMYANLKEVIFAGSSTDKETCWFTGIACMPNGQIILVDRNNNKLKTINSEFKLTTETVLENQPFGITVVSASEIAVTIPRENRIDIFNVGASLTRSKSIKISDRGYGITYAGDKFAVACTCASPPSIKIITMNGEEKQEICPDDSFIPMLFRPWYVKLDTTGEMMYVSDCHRSHVTCISGMVMKQFVYKDNSLNAPRGLHVTKDGRVIVCGFGSDNVQILGKDGYLISDVLTRTDDVMGPQDIALTTTEDKLILTFDPSSGNSDKIHVYDVKL
ncbi:tripartite motif-containing protein 2-like [Mercenaria mercenaria]|uniref:tripartite motif-containing protein 2-like n=1 Tax=Mercenaria mercenaria TaxID=6596 RepID=UPI00234FA659|nr:tripartite motif-containing protein 2-like [Mercenaria mercenaria]XP_045169259.2 tripartite motif-containing protein 2-like [Mercenaria mercenaria]XP_045169260.2 tripartite motif-containing protein 2-like [Mercenaria mercenaria]